MLRSRLLSMPEAGGFVFTNLRLLNWSLLPFFGKHEYILICRIVFMQYTGEIR